jgi:hypothetical protein
MASGFLEYSIAYASSSANLSSGTYVAHLLTTPSSSTTSKGFPSMPTSGCKWSHLEIKIDTSTTFGTTSVFIGATAPLITWDSDGTIIAAGPAQGTTNIALAQCPGDPSAGFISLDIDIEPTFPLGDSNVEPNKVYLWLRTDNTNTARVVLARLHWQQTHKG